MATLVRIRGFVGLHRLVETWGKGTRRMARVVLVGGPHHGETREVPIARSRRRGGGSLMRTVRA